MANEPVLEQPKSYAELRSEAAHAEAEKLGLVVIVPKSNQLFIDIDTESQMSHFDRCFPIFLKRHACRKVTRPSPSGGRFHFHIVVTLLEEDVDARTRVLYQACLGSDPVREVLSLQRIELGDTTPTLFFEKPENLQ